jgi:hypothetical protein
MEWWSGGVAEWWSGGVVKWRSGGARLPKDLSTLARLIWVRRSLVRDVDSRAEPGPGHATTMDPMSCGRAPGSIHDAYTKTPAMTHPGSGSAPESASQVYERRNPISLAKVFSPFGSLAPLWCCQATQRVFSGFSSFVEQRSCQK